jgi:hypothetical protein
MRRHPFLGRGGGRRREGRGALFVWRFTPDLGSELPPTLVAHHVLHGAFGFAGDLYFFASAVGAVFTQLAHFASDLYALQAVDFVFAFFANRHTCLL